MNAELFISIGLTAFASALTGYVLMCVNNTRAARQYRRQLHHADLHGSTQEDEHAEVDFANCFNPKADR